MSMPSFLAGVRQLCLLAKLRLQCACCGWCHVGYNVPAVAGGMCEQLLWWVARQSSVLPRCLSSGQVSRLKKNVCGLASSMPSTDDCSWTLNVNKWKRTFASVIIDSKWPRVSCEFLFVLWQCSNIAVWTLPFCCHCMVGMTTGFWEHREISFLFGRLFVKWFAVCYQTLVCLSVPSVTLVYYGQTVE